MKTLFLASLLFAVPAHATAPNEFDKIYKALDVKPKDVTGGRLGAVTMEKSVGGLVCTESHPVVPKPKPSYTCTLAQKNNAAAIWNALKVEAEDQTDGRLGATTHTKSVGELDCTETKVVYPGAKPKYECDLDLGNDEDDEADSESAPAV